MYTVAAMSMSTEVCEGRGGGGGQVRAAQEVGGAGRGAEVEGQRKVGGAGEATQQEPLTFNV